MIAEGAGKAEDFCEYVRKYTDVEIKATVLGYIQRGGNPSAFDRVLAAKMGQRAVELLADEANMRGTDRAGSRAAENNDLQRELRIRRGHKGKPHYQRSACGSSFNAGLL